LTTPIGPGSSIAAIAIVNEIKVQTAQRLLDRGAMPPVLTSASVVGPAESARLFDAAYAEHARRLARALSAGEPDEAVDRSRRQDVVDDEDGCADDAGSITGAGLDDLESRRGQR